MSEELTLPGGWLSMTLDGVADVHDDLREPVNAEERKGRVGPYPYYGATGQVGWIDDFLMDGEYVLLGEDGAPFLDPTRNKAYLVSGKAWVNNHAHVLRGKEGVCRNRYLLHALNHADYREFANGTTRLKLTQAAMRRLPIRLPPPLEQDRIVAKIEELFSNLDAGVAALERVRANLKRYRAAVLKAAVEGRLTEEWRKHNPVAPEDTAPKLLERILAARRAKWEQDQLRKFKEAGKTPPKGWKEKYREPCLPDVGRLVASTPRTWAITSTEQLADMSLGKMLDREKHQTGKRLPYLRNINVRWGWVDKSDVLEMFFEDDQLDRFGLLPGDVLVCEGGEPGRAAVWNEHDPAMKFQKAIHRIRCRCGFVSQLLVLWLEHLAKSGRLERFFTGSTIKHLTGESFATLPVPLPPLAEQAAIVAEVDRRLSVADAAEQQVEHALQRAARLRQAILKRAFEGKLVPQDPTDEPAAALLERIKAGAVAGSNGHRAVTRNKDNGAASPTKRRSRARA